MAGPNRRRRGEPSPDTTNSSSNVNRNRLNRNRKTQSSSNSSNNKKILISLVVIAAGLITAGILIFYMEIDLFSNQNPNSSNTNNTDTESASQILRKSIEICNDIQLYELQIEAFLLGEPISNLLKRELRPVQERIASLKTQTSQYEKMERITGGPTSFIISSLKELDSIEDNQLAQLDEQVQKILNEDAKLAQAMLISGDKVMRTGLFLVDSALTSHHLINEGIYIVPTSEMDDGQFFENMMTKVTLDEIVQAISRLIPKLDKKHEYLQKLKDLKTSLGLESWDEVSDVEEEGEHPELTEAIDGFEKWSSAVEEDTQKNFVLYQLLLPLNTQRTERVAKLQEDLLNYTAKKRRAYLNLKTTIKDDIRKLKTRVQNLRYKYAKIPEV